MCPGVWVPRTSILRDRQTDSHTHPQQQKLWPFSDLTPQHHTASPPLYSVSCSSHKPSQDQGNTSHLLIGSDRCQKDHSDYFLRNTIYQRLTYRVEGYLQKTQVARDTEFIQDVNTLINKRSRKKTMTTKTRQGRGYLRSNSGGFLGAKKHESSIWTNSPSISNQT